MTKTTLIIFFIISSFYIPSRGEKGCPFRSSECKQHCLEKEGCNESSCGGWLWQDCKCLQCTDHDSDHEESVNGTLATISVSSESVSSESATSESVQASDDSTTGSVTTAGSEGSGMGTSDGTTGSIEGASEDTNKVGSDEMPHEDIFTDPLE